MLFVVIVCRDGRLDLDERWNCVVVEGRVWQMTSSPLTCEAGTVDVLHTVIRDEEPFLPAHENRTAVTVGEGVAGLLQLVLDRLECREPLPVHHIVLLGSVPLPREEPMSAANDFGIEIRCQLGPVVSEAANAEVTAEERGVKVNVLQRRATSMGGLAKAQLPRTMIVTLTSYEFRPLFWVPVNVAPG